MVLLSPHQISNPESQKQFQNEIPYFFEADIPISGSTIMAPLSHPSVPGCGPARVTGTLVTNFGVMKVL